MMSLPGGFSYAVYVREAKKKEENPLPFEEWKKSLSNENNRKASDDTGGYPTSNPSSQTASNNKADKPPSRHRFSPPNVDEVKQYCREQGLAVDPQWFIDYYTSNGWKVGKNPMKDWKAVCRS